MTDCLFCRIIRKEIPSRIVFENERVLAFRDVNPQAPVHVLIVPKLHIAGLNDILTDNNALLGEIQNIAREIALKENVAKSGWRLVCNCGPDAGQAVAHLHYHLLGGRAMHWPPG
jgi:histidine triad (HIT) family protein